MTQVKTKKQASKPDLEWTGYASDEEVKDYAESNEVRDEETNELDIAKAERMLGEDSDYWQWQWESFTEAMTELMGEKKYWYAQASNMGWMHRSGSKVFKAEDGAEFLRAISPNTDCHYTINKTGQGFRIRIGHHDAPMGEHHIVKALTEAQYERMNG